MQTEVLASVNNIARFAQTGVIREDPQKYGSGYDKDNTALLLYGEHDIDHLLYAAADTYRLGFLGKVDRSPLGLTQRSLLVV